MSDTSITDRVHRIVEPLLAERQLELVDVEHRGGQLRLTVDRAGGIDLDAVSEATRLVSRALDEHDPIPGRYTLEVSSPGLERVLRTPAHFARAVGEQVAVKLVATVEGDRRVTGQLVDAGDDRFAVRTADGAELSFGYGDVERARTVFEWGPAGPQPKPKVSRPDKKDVPTR